MMIMYRVLVMLRFRLTVAFFEILWPPHHGVALSVPDTDNCLLTEQYVRISLVVITAYLRPSSQVSLLLGQV